MLRISSACAGAGSVAGRTSVVDDAIAIDAVDVAVIVLGLECRTQSTFASEL